LKSLCSVKIAWHVFDLGKKPDYTDDELAISLGDANLGPGCGNPLTIADLKPGETVLDLGSGAGFDTFLAAKKVEKEEKVTGVEKDFGFLENVWKLLVQMTGGVGTEGKRYV